MDLRIKLKPRKYTIKAQNLNYAYYQILDKLKNGETPTLDKTAKTIWTNIGLCNLRRY
jgi:hypothetical protein